MIQSIGDTAGKVWKFLNEKGEANIIQLIEGVEGDWILILQVIGWLAREDKLLIVKKEGKGLGRNGARLRDRIWGSRFKSGAVDLNPRMVPLEARPRVA